MSAADGAVVGFRLRTSLRDDSVEAERKKQGPQMVSMWEFVQHRSLYLAKTGATPRTSHKKQDLSIWLDAFSGP